MPESTSDTMSEGFGLIGQNSFVGPGYRALYAIPEAMVLLSLSRTQIYELIRSDRLLTVTQGRRRLVPAEAISAYVALLLSEAGSGRDRAA